MIPQDINDRHSRSMIESTATPGVPGRAVVNPDGSNVTNGCVTNGTTMIRTRSSSQLTMTDGNRYGQNVTRSSGTMIVPRSLLVVKWIGTAGSTFVPRIIMF